MSAIPNQRMTVDEFLTWGQHEESRWELHDGQLVAMSPERLVHVRTKGSAFLALNNAIASAKSPCLAFPDGATVRISARTAFAPDALIYCGPPPPNSVEIPAPMIVVEVLSEGTAARDHGTKLEGYFSLPSVIHYLILDPDGRMAIHRKRGDGDLIETRIVRNGVLRFDPPGLEIAASDTFPPP